MTGHIAISIWLFILLLAVAILAILDRVLIPSTRWFLRRRINRVIDEIGTRLDIELIVPVLPISNEYLNPKQRIIRGRHIKLGNRGGIMVSAIQPCA